MRPVLILYSSSEGQTRKFAARVIEYLTSRGKEARVDDVENPIESVDAANYRALVLVASVHLGQHASQMMSFARRHRDELARLPAALLPVSLTAASADDEQDATQHPRSFDEVARATQMFLECTGFAPSCILPLAGTLLYTRRGQFVRFIVQPVAQDGVDTDGDRDFERTAWKRLDSFIDDFLNIRPALPSRKAAPAHR
jgi:menaquinone-dependent protoporphyrinogen oxidase